MNRSLLLLLGLAGYLHLSAQFGPQRLFAPAVGTPWCVQPADLDGDGDQDVVAALVGEGRIVWYVNDGTGLFNGPLVVNDAAPYAKFALASDLDDDGDLDVVAGYGSPAVFVWHSNDGSGTFSPAQVIQNDEGSPYSLSLSDLDGDGDTDVITSAQVGGVVWSENLGGGNWAAHVVDDVNAAPADIAVGDLNGDGDPDLLLAASGSTTVHWRANSGAGVFGPQQILSTVAANGVDVEAADIDGDGDIDAAYITNWSHSLGWFENLGGGTFSPPNVLSTTLSLPTWLHAEDMDQDGLADLLVAVKWNNQVQYWHSAGAGNFDPPAIIADAVAGAYCVAAADIDGDGRRDALFCSEGDDKIGWCTQSAPNNFEVPRLLTWSLDGPVDVQLADLDGDGDRDPVASSWTDGGFAWFPNDGAGNLGEAALIGRDHEAPAPMVLADLDADGDTDIAVGFYNGTVGWYANDGAAQFGPLQTISHADTVLRSIAAADLNGDGSLDLVSASQMAPGQVAWYASTGAGTFGAQQVIESALGFMGVACADLDADGDQDLVATQMPDQLMWFTNNGSGAFSPHITIADSVNQAYCFALDDLDGDADVDIMVVRQPVIVFDGGSPIDTLPRVVWYANDGTGNFGPEQAVADHAGTAQLHLVDIDADGDVDAALALSTGEVVVHLNDGAGSFTAIATLPAPAHVLSVLNSGDMDGDGDPDLLTTTHGYDQIGWYENYFGSVYRISGRVFLDLDGDGNWSTGDTSSAFLSASTSPMLSTALTDPLGSYTFYLDEGDYTVTATAPNALWQISTAAATIDASLSAPNPVSAGNDFGFAPVADTTLLVPSLTMGTGVCNGTVHAWLTVSNQGTRVEQGLVRLDLDTPYTYVNAVPAPDSIVGHSLFWSFSELGYFEQVAIDVFVQQPPVTAMGDSLTTLLTVERNDGLGATTHTFTDEVAIVLACSYDPNDKQVLPAGYGVHGAVPVDTDELTYIIRFQNTGNATAQDVMIRDLLDADLDRSSLHILAASHALTDARVEADGEAVFRFAGILLPDSTSDPLGSQGYVRFSVRMRAGAGHLTTLHNTAEILFDLNPPVVTNTTTTTLVDCALWQAAIQETSPNVLEATPGDAYQWYLDGFLLSGETGPWMLAAVPGLYTVAVISAHGCMALSDGYEVISTGIQPSAGPLMALLPNPARDETRLLLSAPLSSTDLVTLVNTDGGVVRTLRGDGSRVVLIERNGLAPGLYMVRVLRSGVRQGAARLVFE